MEKKTLNEIYQEWRAMKRRLVKESSFSTYAINIEKHILPVFGMCRTVDNDTAQQFAFKLAAEGLSANTVKSVLLMLNMLLQYGYRRGWTERPDLRVILPREAKQAEFHVLGLDDQRTFMCYLLAHITPFNLGIYICLCTGLRIGEICGLKWGDINLRARLLVVKRTVSRIYLENGGRWGTKVVVTPPKTRNSRREIPISSSLAALLRPLAKYADPAAYILSGSDTPVEPHRYRNYYQRLAGRLGVPLTKFHGLRHTFATRCIESNCDCKTVSSILGHANISTTLNLYVHPDMALKRKCIDRMLRTVKVEK